MSMLLQLLQYRNSSTSKRLRVPKKGASMDDAYENLVVLNVPLLPNSIIAPIVKGHDIIAQCWQDCYFVYFCPSAGQAWSNGHNHLPDKINAAGCFR